MTKGKIVLGVAAAIVTVGTGLAFKSAKKSNAPVFGYTLSKSICKECASLWTVATSGKHANHCFTKTGNKGVELFGTGSNSQTWYTKSTCNLSHITRVTTSN